MRHSNSGLESRTFQERVGSTAAFIGRRAEEPLMRAELVTHQGPDRWTTTTLFETSLPALLNAPMPVKFRF